MTTQSAAEDMSDQGFMAAAGGHWEYAAQCFERAVRYCNDGRRTVYEERAQWARGRTAGMTWGPL